MTVPLGEILSGRLVGFRQKLSKGVAETSISLNTNTLGGLGQLLCIIQPLFLKFNVSLMIVDESSISYKNRTILIKYVDMCIIKR